MIDGVLLILAAIFAMAYQFTGSPQHALLAVFNMLAAIYFKQRS